MPIGLKLDVSIESVRARPREMALDKVEWLTNQMQQMRATDRYGSVQQAHDVCERKNGTFHGASSPGGS